MSRKTAVLLACLVTLSVGAVAGAQAQTTTNWELDTSSETVTFEPGDGNTITETVTVTNNDGNESVDISASFRGAVSHSVTQPGTVGPGESADIIVELDSSESGSATLEVSGGGKTETVDYTVRTPAYLEISGVPSWLDDDGVLRGDSRTATITVEEVGGYQGFSGIDVSGDTGNLGVSDLENTALSADGQTTVDITFSADSDAPQYRDIGGSLDLNPNDGFDEESDVFIESFVAFPPQFGRASIDISEIVFDEPRSVGTISRTATIEVENSGDRELDFDRVSFGGNFRVNVLDQPDTIDRTSNETIEVEIGADTGLDEGSYDFTTTFRAAAPGVENSDFESTIDIEHEIEMSISESRLPIGDIPIGESKSTGLTVTEELGYQDIENADLTLEDGPQEWIEVTQALDDTVEAGETSSVEYQVQFDPGAEIGTEYTWTYVIGGNEVEAKEATVSATPISANLEEILDRLQGTSAATPALGQARQETIDLVEEMDQQIRSGDVPQEDITPVLTYADGVIRYVQATNTADDLISDGDHAAAQNELIRAAVAFDTMATYGDAIRDDELRTQAASIGETAGTELDNLLEEQGSHYQERLESGETAPIEEARIKRELARIAALQGDTERAQSLETDAEEAFDTYSSLVGEGEQARQDAVDTWDEMESDIFVSALGQQLVLNPVHYDTFEERSEAMLASYDDAEAAFDEAGEENRSATVVDERARRASALTVARWSLFGSIAATVLTVVLLTIHAARGMYWYVQDSQESISGDFLV